MEKQQISEPRIAWWPQIHKRNAFTKKLAARRAVWKRHARGASWQIVRNLRHLFHITEQASF